MFYNILQFVLLYDIDVFDDCQAAKFYKCSPDNRILYRKLAPNQYQPITIDQRIESLKYYYPGIPTKIKNGYYSIPHQDIKPMFLSFQLQSNQPQSNQLQGGQLLQSNQSLQQFAIIQDDMLFVDLQNDFVVVKSNTFHKQNIYKTFIGEQFLVLEFELLNYDFRLLYFIDVNNTNTSNSTARPLLTNVKYNKNQLVYLSESALFWNITITSIFTDVILEIAELFIVYLWNLLKHKVLSRQLNKQLQQANEQKALEFQHCLAMYEEKIKADLQQTMKQKQQKTALTPAIEIDDMVETHNNMNVVNIQ